MTFDPWTRHLVSLIPLFPLLFPVFSRGAEVQFIVGGYMHDEGGQWDPRSGVLKNPFGVEFDSLGNLYVVELEGGRVHRIDQQGQVTRIAGDGSKSYRGDGGPASDATFNGMHNCAITPDDQLLIADSWNHCVRRLDLGSGTIDTIIGSGTKGHSGDGGAARQATFDYIMCITLNHDASVLYIADLNNRRVRAVDFVSGIVRNVAGNGEKGVPRDGAEAAQSPLVDPRAVAADRSGNVYILERGGHALRAVRPDGTIHTVAGAGQNGHQDGPALQAMFGSPKHLCCDDEGHVYIADDLNGAVRRYDPLTDRVDTILGRGFGDPRIRLSHPHGVTVHGDQLYVVDSGNDRILRWKLK
jgi:sugar lactone lactonase YvrE